MNYPSKPDSIARNTYCFLAKDHNTFIQFICIDQYFLSIFHFLLLILDFSQQLNLNSY